MPAIEASIKVVCADGAVVTIPNPEHLLGLTSPMWAKWGMLYSAHEEIKAHDIRAREAPASKSPPREYFREFGSRRWIIHLAGWLRGLEPAIRAELVAQVRRVTGKTGDIWDHDIVVCLTTRCGVSYSEAKDMPTPERSRLLTALPDYHGEPGTSEIDSAQTRAKLEQAIGDLGVDAKVEAIIKRAHVNGKRGREILRELEQKKKYGGFTRAKPKRYPSILPEG